MGWFTFTLILAGLLLALFAGIWLYKRFFGSGEFLYEVNADDPIMQEAMKKARATLPEFWELKQRGDLNMTDFSLKVRFQGEEDIKEHIWLGDVEKTKDGFSGHLGNEPQFVDSLNADECVSFSEDQITDWMYMKDEKVYGNYTMRAQMQNMSLSDKEMVEFRAMFGEAS
jgi:uncharacterized protein YegJ (DUF2314 family)